MSTNNSSPFTYETWLADGGLDAFGPDASEFTDEEKLCIYGEDRVYEDQERWIRDHFGPDAAKSANYGWGVDVVGSQSEVRTKVYGHGVLNSRYEPSIDEVLHDFIVLTR